MRSAEHLHRLMLITALGAALSGCASLGEAFDKSVDSVKGLVSGPSAPSTAPATPAAAPAASAAAAAAAPRVEEAPMDPAAQRAFDDARRALRAGRTDDAQRGFLALTKSHPALGGPHANLGVLYRQAGKTAEAVAELETAVKASPQQPLYFNQLGIAYRANGQFKKAAEAYERALSLDGNYASAVLNLGILNDLYLGNGARALELYERYLALTPAGDPTVTKWVADLKNRKPAQSAAKGKEKS